LGINLVKFPLRVTTVGNLYPPATF
jgi:hypothetical protein